MTALTEMGEGVFVNVREVTPVREKFKRISELVLCNEMEQLHIKTQHATAGLLDKIFHNENPRPG